MSHFKNGREDDARYVVYCAALEEMLHYAGAYVLDVEKALSIFHSGHTIDDMILE